MKPKWKRRILYITASLLFIVILVGLFFHQLFNDAKNAMHDISTDSISFSDRQYQPYITDFPKLKDLELHGTCYSKSRNPIEEFLYDNYYVFLYRLPVTNDKSLGSVLQTKLENINVESGGYYDLLYYDTVQQPCNYSVQYRAGKPALGHLINFTLSGENIKTLKKNDSVYCYYAELNNFSIGYDKTNTPDFLGSLKAGSKAVSPQPIQIIFRKKNNGFYLFMVINNESKKVAHNNLLVNSEIVK